MYLKHIRAIHASHTNLLRLGSVNAKRKLSCYIVCFFLVTICKFPKFLLYQCGFALRKKITPKIIERLDLENLVSDDFSEEKNPEWQDILEDRPDLLEKRFYKDIENS